MNTFFECKVKYVKIDEQTGKQKKVNLPYLVDAVNHTEAEARIHKEMKSYVSGAFDIPAIKKVNYADLFFYEDGFWYEAKISFVTIDEQAGKEKKVTNTMLVMANDLEEARFRIDLSLQAMTVDYRITAIKETKIADVFQYFKEE